MRTQLDPVQDRFGRVRAGSARYVLNRNGLLTRAPDLSGLTGAARQSAIDAFLAGETLVGYFAAETGGSVSTTYPLTSDFEGRCPNAWFPAGSYDHYCPDDSINPLERWEALSFGGVLLGHAQITSDFVRTGPGSSDVPGLAITVDVGVRPIIVEFGGLPASSSASGITLIQIIEGASQLAGCGPALTTLAWQQTRRVRQAPSPGSHTYKITLTQIIAGNGTLKATPADPAYIAAFEV